MMTLLNQNLIEKQELDDDAVEELECLHETRARMFDKMAALDPKNDEDKDTLILYSHLLESLEYNMQRVWKFDQDRNFHTWWMQVPHCTCPKMDNNDPLYFGTRIFRHDCPIHNHLLEQHVGETYEIDKDDIGELLDPTEYDVELTEKQKVDVELSLK